MRMVFSSPRLENAEAVAQMLRDAGIEVKLANDRSYKGARRQGFSYRDPPNADSNPQVWVVKAEDQPKARAMLREQGLIDSTRQGVSHLTDGIASTFLPPSAHAPAPRRGSPRAALVLRVRLFLLIVIAALTVLIVRGGLHN
ncbi:MAG: pathogenicity-like protein [Proteobacteria bacterium]|nr:pathogenicity-like protein [Pseudomonadota bacterium]MBS0464086.1 pathogenicity-like protein [Pseudomonadota bacterium]